MADGARIKVQGQWQGGMKFQFHDGFGHSLTIDAPASDGAPFDGFMPAYLMLSALAACSAIDIAAILRKQRQRLQSLEVSIEGRQAPNPPWEFRKVRLLYTLKGRNLDKAKVQRAIDLSENKYCSVGATMRGVAKITSDYKIEAIS
jgi:putative redox protein